MSSQAFAYTNQEKRIKNQNFTDKISKNLHIKRIKIEKKWLRGAKDET